MLACTTHITLPLTASRTECHAGVVGKTCMMGAIQKLIGLLCEEVAMRLSMTARGGWPYKMSLKGR